RLRKIYVGAAVIAGHVETRFELPPGKVGPDTVALVVVAAIVDNDVGHRRLVTRLAPQRLRPAEEKAAVAHARDHRPVGPRELGAGCRGDAPAEHVGPGRDVGLVV